MKKQYYDFTRRNIKPQKMKKTAVKTFNSKMEKMVKSIDEKRIAKHKNLKERYLPSGNDMKDYLKPPLIKSSDRIILSVVVTYF